MTASKMEDAVLRLRNGLLESRIEAQSRPGFWLYKSLVLESALRSTHSLQLSGGAGADAARPLLEVLPALAPGASLQRVVEAAESKLRGAVVSLMLWAVGLGSIPIFVAIALNLLGGIVAAIFSAGYAFGQGLANIAITGGLIYAAFALVRGIVSSAGNSSGQHSSSSVTSFGDPELAFLNKHTEQARADLGRLGVSIPTDSPMISKIKAAGWISFAISIGIAIILVIPFLEGIFRGFTAG